MLGCDSRGRVAPGQRRKQTHSCSVQSQQWLALASTLASSTLAYVGYHTDPLPKLI